MKTIYYVAFSIAGTNAFITAHTTKPRRLVAVEKAMPGFTLGTSRRPNYDEDDGIKLMWDKLFSIY